MCLLNKIFSLLPESQRGRKPENIATRWGLKSRMPWNPREHCKCIGKATWSTFLIGLHKNKAVAPGGKLSLARRKRWREKTVIQKCSASPVPKQSKQTRQPLINGEKLQFQLKK